MADFLSSTDPNDIKNVLNALAARLAELELRNTEFGGAGEAMDSISDLDYRVVGEDGNLRLVISAIDLIDELGINAHFVALAVDGVTPTVWLNADTGKFTSGGGLVFMDEDGISILANDDQYDDRSYKFTDGTDRIGGLYSYFVDASHQVVAMRTFAKAGRAGYADVIAEGSALAKVRIIANASLAGSASFDVVQNTTNGYVMMNNIEYLAFQEFATDPAYVDGYALFYYLDTGAVKVRHKQGATETEITLGSAGTPDSSGVTYTPTTAADWNGSADPGDVDNALDQLADRTKTLEGASGSAVDYDQIHAEIG